MTPPDPNRPTGDPGAEIASHLQMIESQYPVTITNKDQVAERILRRMHHPRDVLTIVLSLNHWVAVNGITGEVAIPDRVLDLIFERVR